MKVLLAIVALVILLFVAPAVYQLSTHAPAPEPASGLPWQIEPLAGGNSRVFGLTLGASTLEDARARLGKDMEVAVVAAPGEPGSLEAYYESIKMGFVTGKLILTADVTPETVEQMRQRAAKTEYMQSSTKKSTLQSEDLGRAYSAPIRALAFVPSVNLDEEIVLQRFGEPAERIRSSDHLEHFLYPDKGLSIALDSRGKELLQYVPPRNFERLRAPLAAAAG